MMRSRLSVQRLAALFLLGCVLFNYPVLAIFGGGQLFGMPALYVWLMGAWLVLIGLMAWVVERKHD